ncbi:carbamoyltransferase [Streptomyces sp. NPDC058371]|uniref:carbamoyltransferase family protein n=1 Tax=Streptomyces sp. NPDC058371 TaxID=3346463 RepID=UPI0036664BC8
MNTSVTAPGRTVLGVSAFFHDSAAALVRDGRVLAAAQQERFSRRRHDASFPAEAIEYCLREGGLTAGELDAIAYYEDPRLKFRRVLATWLGTAPAGAAVFSRTLPEWLTWKARAASTVRRRLAVPGAGPVPPVEVVRHHESHAGSAFLAGPFEHAAVLCVDGVGEWATTSIWHGQGERLRPVAEIRFPHSLGLLYSAFTYFCGFKVDSGEYKLMGLAPYGVPRYADLIRTHLIDLRADGSFRLDLRYFEYLHGQVMTGAAFERLIGAGPRRMPESDLTDRECDLAASVQQVTEQALLAMARTALERTGEKRLCLAGGVALNCVANGRIAESGVTDEMWVQPAAGDAGGALGAALVVSARRGGPSRPHLGTGRDAMAGALLGPCYDDDTVAGFLDGEGLPYERLERPDLPHRVAELLARGRVVGWFQGRMEFGPRALGARSILADPRYPDMQTTLNLKIKFRESFRPFAPAVPAEDAKDWFDLTQPSPYMLLVARIAAGHHVELPEGTGHGLDSRRIPRSAIPAVTHVDHSARVQTVSQRDNPEFHRLLTAFKAATGCPVLVNTSFNVRGEPIVATPRQAYACFMRTGMDALVIGRHLLLKEDQPPWHDEDWRQEIPAD